MIDDHHHTWKFSKNWIELLMQVMELNPKKKIFEGPRMWWAECVWNDSETSFFSFMFLQLISYEDHQQQQQQQLLLLLPIPTNFMSSLCSFFQQSSLLSMSKVRTSVSSSSSYRDCVLLSCIHSQRILFYFIFGWKFSSVESKLNVNKVQINSCLWGRGVFTLGECLFNFITCKTQFNMKLGERL